jgi:hypothetical protein
VIKSRSVTKLVTTFTFGIYFSVMQNMIVNKVFKEFRGIFENRNAFIVACRSMIAPFEHGYNSSFLPCSREVLLSEAQVKYTPKSRNKSN